MYTVKHNGEKYLAGKLCAMAAWMRGARVYDESGREVQGIDHSDGVDRFIF